MADFDPEFLKKRPDVESFSIILKAVRATYNLVSYSKGEGLPLQEVEEVKIPVLIKDTDADLLGRSIVRALAIVTVRNQDNPRLTRPSRTEEPQIEHLENRFAQAAQAYTIRKYYMDKKAQASTKGEEEKGGESTDSEQPKHPNEHEPDSKSGIKYNVHITNLIESYARAMTTLLKLKRSSRGQDVNDTAGQDQDLIEITEIAHTFLRKNAASLGLAQDDTIEGAQDVADAIDYIGTRVASRGDRKRAKRGAPSDAEVGDSSLSAARPSHNEGPVPKRVKIEEAAQ